MGDFHRDRNLDRIRLASRQRTTVQVGGTAVEIRLASWQEPQRVILAQLALRTLEPQVASLNTSREQLLPALSALVVLQGDGDALPDHQRDV